MKISITLLEGEFRPEFTPPGDQRVVQQECAPYVILLLGLIGMFAADYHHLNGFALILPMEVVLFTLATAAAEGISRLRIQLTLPLIVAGGYGAVFTLKQLHEIYRDRQKFRALARAVARD